MPISKVLASFNVQSGRLLLTPCACLKTPDYKYQQLKRRTIGPRKIECPLENLTVYIWSVSVNFSQSLAIQRALSDKHQQLLPGLRPLQITPLRK